MGPTEDTEWSLERAKAAGASAFATAGLVQGDSELKVLRVGSNVLLLDASAGVVVRVTKPGRDTNVGLRFARTAHDMGLPVLVSLTATPLLVTVTRSLSGPGSKRPARRWTTCGSVRWWPTCTLTPTY